MARVIILYGNIDCSDLLYTSDENEIEKYMRNPGDVLFNRTKYLNYALNSQHAKDYYNRVKSDGVNQSNINAQKLGRLKYPSPPI